jgi:hypothetical protein
MLSGRSKKIRPLRIELDYVAPVRRPRWLGLAVLAGAVGAAAWLGAAFLDSRAELARLEAAAHVAAPDRRPARVLPKERLEEETKSAEAVVRELTLPWAALLRSLEEAAMRDVAILQLQPDAHLRVLKLTAEARSQEAMFRYLKRLAEAKNLGDAHLVSHQVQRDDPQRPIQFSVQATLR